MKILFRIFIIYFLQHLSRALLKKIENQSFMSVQDAKRMLLLSKNKDINLHTNLLKSKISKSEIESIKKQPPIVQALKETLEEINGTIEHKTEMNSDKRDSVVNSFTSTNTTEVNASNPFVKTPVRTCKSESNALATISINPDKAVQKTLEEDPVVQEKPMEPKAEPKPAPVEKPKVSPPPPPPPPPPPKPKINTENTTKPDLSSELSSQQASIDEKKRLGWEDNFEILKYAPPKDAEDKTEGGNRTFDDKLKRAVRNIKLTIEEVQEKEKLKPKKNPGEDIDDLHGYFGKYHFDPKSKNESKNQPKGKGDYPDGVRKKGTETVLRIPENLEDMDSGQLTQVEDVLKRLLNKGKKENEKEKEPQSVSKPEDSDLSKIFRQIAANIEEAKKLLKKVPTDQKQISEIPDKQIKALEAEFSETLDLYFKGAISHKEVQDVLAKFDQLARAERLNTQEYDNYVRSLRNPKLRRVLYSHARLFEEEMRKRERKLKEMAYKLRRLQSSDDLKREMKDGLEGFENEALFRRRLIRPEYKVTSPRPKIPNDIPKEFYFDIYALMAKKHEPYFNHTVEPLVPPEDEYIDYGSEKLDGVWDLAKDKNGKYKEVYKGIGQSVNEGIMKDLGFKSPKYVRTLDKQYPGRESDPVVVEADSIIQERNSTNDVFYNPYNKVYGDESLCTLTTASYNCNKNKLCQWCYVSEKCIPKSKMSECLQLLIKLRKKEDYP